MAGIEDSFTIFGDWVASNPSPRTVISRFFNGDAVSKAFSGFGENENHVSMKMATEQQKQPVGPKDEEKTRSATSHIFSEPLAFNAFNVQKSSAKGALGERMAARAGFSSLTVNTNRSGSESIMSSSLDAHSSYVLLSPGVSPTALLESPVFLSNSMAQPSPTTEMFTFPHIAQTTSNSASISIDPEKLEGQHADGVGTEAFAFPHLVSSSSLPCHMEDGVASAIGQKQPSSSMCALLPHDINLLTGFSKESGKNENSDGIIPYQKASDPYMVHDSLLPAIVDQHSGVKALKREFSTNPVSASEEDGYNWRKYGQKQVKGCEFPRSYYKCTHPTCAVKKKVERSLQGHITEIIYKGSHNHPKPPQSRRCIVPLSHRYIDAQTDSSDHPEPGANFDANSARASMHDGVGQDLKSDGTEATSSVSVGENCDPFIVVQAHSGSQFESCDEMDVSSSMSKNEEEDDESFYGSFSVQCDVEGEKLELKRRMQEPCPIDMSAASKVMREPRVVVQTISEVDILDDGYRWRKYGQKVVKGNPNPRSYYKCTHQGCSVRKHVERASHDLKSVITTYEGKHNHDVPSARNSNLANSAPSCSATTSATHPHSFSRRPEMVQDSIMRFEGHASIGTFVFPGREQQLQQPFSFGIGQQRLPYVGGIGLSHTEPLKTPAFAPMYQYMEHKDSLMEDL